jgi:hypothetical protein
MSIRPAWLLGATVVAVLAGILLGVWLFTTAAGG